MSEYEEDAQLDELAARYGIAPDYHDIFGSRHVITKLTKRAILGAMGVAAETRDDLARELAAWGDQRWRQACEPVQVCRIDEADQFWSFRMPAEEAEDGSISIDWTLHDEYGKVRLSGQSGPGLRPTECGMVEENRYVRFELPLPTGLGIGYYDLTAASVSPSGRQSQGRLPLVVAPPHCYAPHSLRGRVWGLFMQLYGLRSARNWGIGDFRDLREWTEWAATELGAGFIGLNPLHALKNSHPYHISPYSPDSRLYLNIVYVDVTQIPELPESPQARGLLESQQFQHRLEELRDHPTVEYERVYAAKRVILEALFSTFQKRHCAVDGEVLHPRTARGRAFEAFIREEGEALEMFAVFQALSDTLRRELPNVYVWQEWPEQYRRPDSAAVSAFRRTHRAQIRFYQYLQWVAGQQLREAARCALASGMPIGLYHDLALGSDRTGVDAWMCQDLLALGADCGAPPDQFAPEGQNWGFPPLIPHRLRAGGYRFFIQLLRHNVQYGGALRIDHVMSLFRLFWIPRGLRPAAGAYVEYPWRDLLGILALESARHRAVIVGEDLGTVADWVRRELAAVRVLSYRVFYFERTEGGGWKAPRDYPSDALAVVSTHDLPTLAGYWAGEDIELRRKLGLIPDEALQRTWDERQHEKAAILAALRREGLLPAEEHAWLHGDVPPELSKAVHAYLARTPSWLMMASLEDLLGERTQINMPGTFDNYPNWSIKTPVPLAQARVNPRVRQLAALLKSIRPLERPFLS